MVEKGEVSTHGRRYLALFAEDELEVHEARLVAERRREERGGRARREHGGGRGVLEDGKLSLLGEGDLDRHVTRVRQDDGDDGDDHLARALKE